MSNNGGIEWAIHISCTQYSVDIERYAFEELPIIQENAYNSYNANGKENENTKIVLHKYAHPPTHTHIHYAYEHFFKKKEEKKRERVSKEICQDIISSCLWLGFGTLKLFLIWLFLNFLWFFSYPSCTAFIIRKKYFLCWNQKASDLWFAFLEGRNKP